MLKDLQLNLKSDWVNDLKIQWYLTQKLKDFLGNFVDAPIRKRYNFRKINAHKEDSILFENISKYKEKENFIKDFNDNKITETIVTYFLDIFSDNTPFNKPPPNMYT